MELIVCSFHVSPLSVTQTIWRRMNRKGYERKLSRSNLGYCSTICLERLKNTTKLRIVVSAGIRNEHLTDTSQICC
jgi:hypothetical protein